MHDLNVSQNSPVLPVLAAEAAEDAAVAALDAADDAEEAAEAVALTTCARGKVQIQRTAVIQPTGGW